MMRCKLHPYETGAGVCASCLRERLFALLDVHPELSADHHHPTRRSSDHSPLHFPRSVSPSLSHRRSIDSDAPRHRRRLHLFYSTPQVGPTFADVPSSQRPRRRDRFSILKSLFGNFRSGEKAEAESDTGTSKSSWFSSILRGRGRRRKPAAAAAAPPPPPRACRASDRGMSPVDDSSDESISYSGYSTDSSSGGWRLPASTPMRRLAATAHHHRHRGVSSFAVHLSPMYGTSRGCQRRCQGSDVPFSGDLRHHFHHRAPVGAASFGLNRSRKLADIGRFR